MTAGAFWDFSLAFYDRPGVSATCISLQDDLDADVSLVLFALWCAQRGCRLGPDDLGRVDQQVGRWRDKVVRPLRSVRRALKPPIPPVNPAATEALRQALLSAELTAERLQQDTMQAAAPPPGSADVAAAAQANLACLARYAGIAEGAAPLKRLAGAFG